MKIFSSLPFILAMIVAAPVAHAQCTAPPAEAGVMIFNADHKVMQYCNGTQWVGLWGGGTGSTLPTCNNGEIAQFTDGQWQCNNGSGLDNLNASNLTSGTVPVARLGASGTRNTTTFLRGDNTWVIPSAGGLSSCVTRTASCTVGGAGNYCNSNCNAGEFATGGGCSSSTTWTVVSLPQGNGWRCSHSNHGSLTTHVRCCK